MGKPKVASDWMAGCSGCHMSLLDIDERIIDLVGLVDIRATPITDLKEPDIDGVDVGILEGGVNNTSNEEQAHKMRARCKILVAFGDCAVFGGVPAMRNYFEIEEALRRAYVETESTDIEGLIPDDPELSKPTPVRALKEIVPVDIYLPGCPPDPDAIFYVLGELANGRLPVIKDNYLHWH
ncbi:MAG: NADP oxidoreductase [Anaerolineaceae bacterium]|nr:NADP oxidoreductase [Anaerolineaceae bacterium]